MGEDAPKESRGRSQTSSVFIALWKLHNSPLTEKKSTCNTEKKSFYFFLIRRKNRQEDTQWQKPLTYISK